MTAFIKMKSCDVSYLMVVFIMLACFYFADNTKPPTVLEVYRSLCRMTEGKNVLFA